MEDIREVAYKGDLQTLRHLIEHLGIKVGDKHSINGTTPLHWAVKGGYSNVVAYLISKGADPNAADNKGVTPLDLAAKASNGVRTVLGLPPHEETYTKKSKDVNALVSSTAFVPVPAPGLPMLPVPSQKISSSISPSSSAPVPSPIPTSSAMPSYTPIPLQQTQTTVFVKIGEDTDLFELDIPIESYEALLDVILHDFLPYQHYDRRMKIAKIRKLPNIIVHNDRDVARLKGGEILHVEVEILNSQHA